MKYTDSFSDITSEILYVIIVVILLLIVSGCENSTEPDEETIFYSDINKELFPYQLTAEVTTYIDTTFDSEGVFRILELPEVKLFVDNNEFTFSNGFEFTTTSTLSNSEPLKISYYHSGKYSWARNPANFYTIKIEDDKLKKIYITMRELFGEKKKYFVIGVNL